MRREDRGSERVSSDTPGEPGAPRLGQTPAKRPKPRPEASWGPVPPAGCCGARLDHLYAPRRGETGSSTRSDDRRRQPVRPRRAGSSHRRTLRLRSSRSALRRAHTASRLRRTSLRRRTSRRACKPAAARGRLPRGGGDGKAALRRHCIRAGVMTAASSSSAYSRGTPGGSVGGAGAAGAAAGALFRGCVGSGRDPVPRPRSRRSAALPVQRQRRGGRG